MEVAVVAPPFYEVPPTRYGGIELVCAALVRGLVGRGHGVTLIATGRHRTSASFVATSSEPHPEGTEADTAVEVVHASRAAEVIEGLDVDVVHDHTCAGPLRAFGRRCPTVVTVHSAVGQDDPGRPWAEAVAAASDLVAVSEAQRRSAEGLPWAATVHNGITVEDHPYRAEKDGFALYLGRFSAGKGVHHAIAAAAAAGCRLVLAGTWTVPAELEYFEHEVRPRLGPGVEWVGPVGGDEKHDLLARARCLLFPVCWPEPFGLVMIESLACGTPVVGLRAGAVAEIVRHRETGVVCDTPDQLPAAIDASAGLSPAACRRDAEQRFSADRMAAGYEAVYQRALDERQG